MAEVGLSQYAVEHILKRYPAYVNWDVEQKLLPAMHQWQQHLGKSFQAEFARLPRLLLGTPGQEVAKLQYLASIGVTSAKRNPAGWHHASLKAMQSKGLLFKLLASHKPKLALWWSSIQVSWQASSKTQKICLLS